jgi:hypothetical protein
MSSCVGFPYQGATAAQVNVGAGANLNITGELTIDAWVQFITSPANSSIYAITRVNVGGYAFGIQGAVTPGRFFLTFLKASVISIESTLAQVQPGRKYHIAVVWDNVNTVKFYIDGVLVDTIVNAGALVATATNAYVGNSGVANSFKGCIFNLNVYNRALSATEILYNKEHPNNPVKRGRQLSVTQESVVGGVWKDLSPNAYDGTFSSSIIIGPSNNLAGRNVLV